MKKHLLMLGIFLFNILLANDQWYISAGAGSLNIKPKIKSLNPICQTDACVNGFFSEDGNPMPAYTIYGQNPSLQDLTNYSYQSTYADVKQNISNGSIVFGYNFSNSLRAGIGYAGFNDSQNISIDEYTLFLDYFPIETYIKPFAGVSAGLLKYNAHIPAIAYDYWEMNPRDINFNHAFYGFRVGGLIKITNLISAQATYEKKILNAETSSNMHAGSDWEEKYELDSYDGWNFSINYKF